MATTQTPLTPNPAQPSPAGPGDSPASQESKHLYQSCVNMSQIVKIDDAPLRAGLADLGGWPITFPDTEWVPPDSLEMTVARIRKRFNTGVLVDLWVGPDDRHSDVNVVQVDQPQLGLPSRDYFLKPESQRNLNAYHNYMTEVDSGGTKSHYATLCHDTKCTIYIRDGLPCNNSK